MTYQRLNFDTSINRIIIIFIFHHLIKHFQIMIIRCKVLLIKLVNNVNEAARIITKRQQQL